MPREIVLARYGAHPFKDHWAIFVPSAQRPNFGTLIQVQGDVRSGFKHSITRNYDATATRRNIKLTRIGMVADIYVHATPSSGNLTKDAKDRRDDIERAAMSVPAPGPSMRPTQGNAPPTQRVQFSDCQWWVRSVIEKVVANGMLDQAAIRVLDATPRN